MDSQGFGKNMEPKTWLWQRMPSEKTIIKEKALVLERSLKNLNEQLSSARNESDAKDDLIGKQAKVAEEAIAGWEKAEAEAASFKQDLDDALYQKTIVEEKVISIDATLKECVQQLLVLKDEQQHSVNDAAVKTLQEQEKNRVLEERFADANKRLHQLSVENSNLHGILEIKEKLIEDLSLSKLQSEADFATIVERLDFSEKSYESLKYEARMLQKELAVRSQEREFNLRSLEAAQKQHLENVRKIKRLESECQRLRVMIQKRLPGPAAIAKMRSEVDMLGNSVPETIRRKSNSSLDASMPRNFAPVIGHDALSKQVDRLHAIEDENKILKETVTKKNNELKFSRIMFARTASKLSQTEKQLKELSKRATCLELSRSSSIATYKSSLTSAPDDGGNEDNISCAESWASALISQLEQFRNGKPATPLRAAGSSESNFMDDFAEMEKLAIVCVDKPGGSSTVSGEDMTPKTVDSKQELLESTGKELVPLTDFGEFNHGDQTSLTQFEKCPSWLQDILKLILQKHHTTQLNMDAILHEVKVALSKNGNSVEGKLLDPLLVSDKTCQRPYLSSFDSADEALSMINMLPNETGNQLFQLNMKKALYRLIDLTEGIIQRATEDDDRQHLLSLNDLHGDPWHKQSSATGQTACIFLWESSELIIILRHFIAVCNNMLCGQAEVEKFVGELASTLGWIIDHCFSLKDVSAVEKIMKKKFSGDYLNCNDDTEVEGISPKEANYKTGTKDRFKLRLGKSSPSSTAVGVLHILSKTGEIESKLRDENRKLKYDNSNIESEKKDAEEKLKSANTKNKSLVTQLVEPGKSVSNLQAELSTLKDSRGLIEEQNKDQKLISQDLGNQLTAAKIELNIGFQKFAQLGAELEGKSNCCEELEAKCLELQLQIESESSNEIPKYVIGLEERDSRTDRDISAASEKLAECQETILKLGKQLKALALPKDTALFNSVISSSAIARTTRSPQLLDQMIAVDNAKFEDLKSPQTKEMVCSKPQNPEPAAPLENRVRLASPEKSQYRPHELGGLYKQKWGNEVGTLVQKKQKFGIGLLRKLISGKRQDSSKKLVVLHNGSFST